MTEREILFRGKRIDNGAWVYGFYTCFNGKKHRIYSGYAETDCGDYYPDYYNIDPETVGEYTGLIDKNGAKVFEGDILQTRRKVPKSEEQVFRFVVKYGEYIPKEYCKAIYSQLKTIGFYCADGNKDFQLSTCSNCFEVIGNIHDNPELLGKAGAE